jgi:hypothetical protein
MRINSSLVMIRGAFPSTAKQYKGGADCQPEKNVQPIARDDGINCRHAKKENENSQAIVCFLS